MNISILVFESFKKLLFTNLLFNFPEFMMADTIRGIIPTLIRSQKYLDK